MAGKKDPTGNSEHRWEGLQEIDRAISENRLTAYSWKKAWADPWGKIKLITIFLALAGFIGFVIINDVLL
ncbi:MAG: hypothetical protein V2I43_19385 [Parvularcula sp.]|jgi:hypothetical protein|nr:hypothetical protein [Parvularcula sp.]